MFSGDSRLQGDVVTVGCCVGPRKGCHRHRQAPSSPVSSGPTSMAPQPKQAGSARALCSAWGPVPLSLAESLIQAACLQDPAHSHRGPQ